MKLSGKLSGLILLAIFGMFVSVPGAYADPVVGDLIAFSDGPGASPGGEFIATKSGAGGYSFRTFCVEGTEYIMTNGTLFEIGSITDTAIMGSLPPNGDPLNYETAYLFTKFSYHALSNFIYDNGVGENLSATQLQIAIWAFEEEEGYTVANVLANYPTSQAAAWIKEAQNAGWTSIGNVRVLNMLWTYNAGYGERAQDILVMVPEPGILILLGIALSAVGLASRRRKS